MISTQIQGDNQLFCFSYMFPAQAHCRYIGTHEDITITHDNGEGARC